MVLVSPPANLLSFHKPQGRKLTHSYFHTEMDFAEQQFSNLAHIRIPLAILLKYRFLGPTLSSDSISLKWGLIICTSNKFVGDANPGPHFEEHCVSEVLTCERVNSKVFHMVPTGDIEGQLPFGAGVWVPGIQLEHRGVQGCILPDRGVKDGSGHPGGVVVDIHNLNVDFRYRGEGCGTLIHCQYRQPVAGHNFSVQGCQSLNHS